MWDVETGIFTLRIAERVGLTGKVYASDIDRTALHSLKKKASAEKLENIKIINGKADNPKLPAGKIDLVLLVNVIHLIEDPEAFFSNIAPCLKEDG
jgi:ubiquinone/menaquinone biosynthesis C-methylase UbiE